MRYYTLYFWIQFANLLKILHLCSRDTFFAIFCFQFHYFLLSFLIFIIFLSLICSSLCSFCHTPWFWAQYIFALANVVENMMQAKPGKNVSMFLLFSFFCNHHEIMLGAAFWKMRHVEQSSGLLVKAILPSLYLTEHSYQAHFGRTTQLTGKLMNNYKQMLF